MIASFILRNWKMVGFGVIVAVLLGTAGYYRIDRDHWRRVAQVLRIDLQQVKTQRDAERKAYRDAQAAAEKLEKERLIRITAEQEEITDEIRKDYSARLAAARARAERLRRQQQAPDRAAGAEQVPCFPDAAGRSNAESCDNGLSLDQRLIATEQAIQLDALQAWIRKQGQVSPN